MEILQLNIKRIPTAREVKKALRKFEGIRYTYNNMEVLKFQKKGKGKVEIDCEYEDCENGRVEENS